MTTTLFLGGSVAPPFQIPGFLGAVGISLSPLIVLGTSSHNADELATWALPIPNQAALAGRSFPVQGLSITAQPAFVFTNSAWLKIR